MNMHIREPINGLTHLFGAVLSVTALILMIDKTFHMGAGGVTITAVVIYGLSLLMLYSASATYHMVIASKSVLDRLQKLDHSMIFMLIAGSYTPLCLISLKGTKGLVIFSIVAAMAVSGILFKMIWFKCPRWVSTGIYIAMGWTAIFVLSPLRSTLTSWGLFWLIGGGVLYTVGGVIYGLKRSIFANKYLGFHEIFHIFILLGSAAHFICIFNYVLK